MQNGDGDPEVRIVMDDVKIEIREKQIFLDKHIIEASDHAKFTVLDRERKLIKEQFEKLFKKQLRELEANVLAYQDLLMTKEIRIRALEKDLIDATAANRTALEAEIEELKQTLELKLILIEDLKNHKTENRCDACYDSDDELTQGTCNKNKLKRRVFKKIEHLNEYIKKEVTPEIHSKYMGEIESLMKQHHSEIDTLKNDYENRMRRIREECQQEIKAMRV